MTKLIAALLGLVLAFPLAAQQGKPPSEGTDYRTLNPPQPADANGKIDVIEFFWYRCPHCYHLEPSIDPWVKKLGRDTQFRRVPAIFSEEWALDARVYYALEATGDGERVHRKLFDAIHNDGGVRLSGDAYLKWMAAWLGKNGVDVAKYEAALRSFSVDTKVKRAAQLTQAYKLDGVPAVAVQGRWLASASENILPVTDYLIGEARKRAAKK